MRVLAALACALCAPAGALLASRASAAEPPPATAGVAPQPQISFTLDVPPPISSWNAVARKAASLQQVECAADLLEKTAQIVDEAEAGDSLAMAALGTMYLFGQACAPKRNLTWGLHWLTRAEELDQPDAQAVMGFLHASDALRDVYNFTGFAANRTHARVLYERAALGGSVYGSMALGYRYGHGIGAVESCASSAAWYERAAEGAVSTLADERAHTVENSNPVEQDHLTLLSKKLPKRDGRMERSAVEYMDYCAHIGDRAGKVGMGHLYHTGAHGVPRDRAAAKHWFRSAARSGDAMGHANLGLMELRDRRFGHALKSLRRATKQNDPSGWAGLGFAFLYGAGVPQSDERAAQCLALAARMGHLDSIYNLGVLTLAGRGVPQNTRAGFRLLSVAAEFSHPTAQWHVGRMARSGLGVLKDCNTAQFFLKHAAEQGPLARSLMMTALTA
jgi:TPR repeat protein